MQFRSVLSLGLTLALTVCLSPFATYAGTPEQSGQEDTPNLLDNGGFEAWVGFDAARSSVPDTPAITSVKLVGNQPLPRLFLPGSSDLAEGEEPVGTVARDNSVYHDGDSSVRIEVSRPTLSTTFVRYMPDLFNGNGRFQLQGQRRYRLTWWVKGKDVKLIGKPGPTMMMYYKLPDGQRVNDSKPDRQLTGTFDWQQREFVFTTDLAEADQEVQTVFSFQLRRATGTLWYDQIRLEDLGPITPVESY